MIGGVLGASDGPRIAVAEVGGWDTHARQAGVLQGQLGALAEALVGVRRGLGGAWRSTVVLCVTEFGRTVHANGTGGTDHGTASVALLAGGAVRGGRVLGDWPGLRSQDLHEGRDLRPTTDLRQLFAGVLHEHLGVERADLARRVFPGTAGLRPLDGLVG